MVEEFAAIRPPTIRPTKPAGRNFNIAGNALSWPISVGSAAGNAAWMSFSSGKMMIEHNAVIIHGQGRRT